MSINLGIGGGDSLERLAQQLADLQDPDLMPLALDLREAIIEGNEQGLLAGLDKDGVPFAPLKESTIKRGRGGFGPPLSPRYSASQLVDRLRVDIEPGGEAGVRVKASWPGVTHLKYHKTGYLARDGSRVPPRNPAGIRPGTRARIGAIIANFRKQMVAKFSS